MSGRSEHYPIDEHGVPLPLLLPRSLADYEHTTGGGHQLTFHHRQFPADAVRGIVPEAVTFRSIDGQLLPRYLHQRLHGRYDGPTLPSTQEAVFRYVVLRCGGYMPRHALELAYRGTRIVVPTAEQRWAIAASLRMDHTNTPLNAGYQRARVGMLLARHVVRQPIEHIKEGLMDEFLHTDDAGRRKELGHLLLKEKVRVAVDPFDLVYHQSYKEGTLMPGAPRTPVRVVTRYFTKNRFSDYLDYLTRDLLAA